MEVAPNVDIMQWFKQRVTNMDSGIPSSASPLLSWVPAGKANHGAYSWYKPDYKDFGPRLSLAYSPDYTSGIGNFLFGGAGKSSIRLGAGIFYDNIGQPIALSSDQDGSPGTATSLTNSSQAFCLGGNVCPSSSVPAPRFARFLHSVGLHWFPRSYAVFQRPDFCHFPLHPGLKCVRHRICRRS